jgi:excisionase family DNA binding protein
VSNETEATTWITPHDGAELAELSYRQFIRLIEDGTLTVRRFGRGRILIRRDEVERLIAGSVRPGRMAPAEAGA